MIKSGHGDCLFCGGTDKISTTPTVHRPFSSKPIIYKTFRLTFFPSDKPSKWIWDFHVHHISIISENSGEVKECPTTPIRHNPICSDSPICVFCIHLQSHMTHHQFWLYQSMLLHRYSENILLGFAYIQYSSIANMDPGRWFDTLPK